MSGNTITPTDKLSDEPAGKVLSSDGKSDNAQTVATSAAATSEEPKTKFEQDLNRMKEMQGRAELPPDEIEPMRKAQVTLLDDGALLGIGFKSFDILEVLGHGAFGKVFKCKLKGKEQEFAMKVLKKAFLYRNKHLKYAITECNILKQAEHPYVIKMHYSFQTPDNLYMILDYCSGCDLAYHLNKKQIFEEEEAKFFIAEVVLAI